MKLFEVINYLLLATRYGSWGIGLIGIVVSIILALANISVGVEAVTIFMATLLGSIAVSLLLGPSKWFIKKITNKKRYIISTISLVAAIIIAGVVYYISGGFPDVNLLFI